MKRFWEVVRNAFCVVGVITGAYFAFIGFFCGPSIAEPYDRHKMSQVVVPPPKPLWQKPQPENPIERITQNLLRELDNLPKAPRADGKLQDISSFEFYEQWRARQPCPPPLRQ